MDTITRRQATDKLDDMREAFTHSATCELPGNHPKCEACENSHYIASVIRDLDEDLPLADVLITAKHLGEYLPYDLDRQVHAIVRTVAE